MDGTREFEYADAGPAGRLNSIEVEIHSDLPDETVSAIYDVFPDQETATRIYSQADSNFRSFQDQSEPSYRASRLSPAVPAFCANQTDGSLQCWLLHGTTTATINVSGAGDPASDGDTTLQALLDHLIAIGG